MSETERVLAGYSAGLADGFVVLAIILAVYLALRLVIDLVREVYDTRRIKRDIYLDDWDTAIYFNKWLDDPSSIMRRRLDSEAGE